MIDNQVFLPDMIFLFLKWIGEAKWKGKKSQWQHIEHEWMAVVVEWHKNWNGTKEKLFFHSNLREKKENQVFEWNDSKFTIE